MIIYFAGLLVFLLLQLLIFKAFFADNHAAYKRTVDHLTTLILKQTEANEALLSKLLKMMEILREQMNRDRDRPS